MKKMWCCIALLLTLSSVSAIQRLNTIQDLKRIDFGSSVPKHSLVLLYWFAHSVNIHGNQIQLTFDPDNKEYGSHHYGNYEDMLGPLPHGYKYYTVGNLRQETEQPLPPYVLNPPTLTFEGNRDRIIFRVRNQLIDHVYLTQHYGNPDDYSTDYDPDRTYQITPNLLREIREFSLRGDYQTLLTLRNRYGSNASVDTIRQTWGLLACLGLFLCIVRERPFGSVMQGARSGKELYRESGSRERPYVHVMQGARSGEQPYIGYGSYHTPQRSDEEICMCLVFFFIIIVVFFACVGILARVLQ